MILPRVAIRGLVSTLSSAFMNILFASTSLDFPTALYVCEVNSSFRKMLEVADWEEMAIRSHIGSSSGETAR